ncbi:hypothetical protein [Deinococcus ruber]|nr:hypothetical protein [Deinococcus ruber]
MNMKRILLVVLLALTTSTSVAEPSGPCCITGGGWGAPAPVTIPAHP